MRILQGWTKEERRELEDAFETKDFDEGAIAFMYLMVKHSNSKIYQKYNSAKSKEETQLAKDIADYYAGVAKFPERKYVLNMGTGRNPQYVYEFSFENNTFGLSELAFKTCRDKRGALTKTKDFFMDHFGEKYLAFAVPVEEDDE